MTDMRRGPEDWKKRLTAAQFGVTRQGGTEPPFTGAYVGNKQAGIYRCICCGQTLFRSEDKYDSGSGWPSFRAEAAAGAVSERLDRSHGMTRTEVLCSSCEAHLGHAFQDGPEPTGLRYCINSVALEFEPTDVQPGEPTDGATDGQHDPEENPC